MFIWVQVLLLVAVAASAGYRTWLLFGKKAWHVQTLSKPLRDAILVTAGTEPGSVSPVGQLLSGVSRTWIGVFLEPLVDHLPGLPHPQRLQRLASHQFRHTRLELEQSLRFLKTAGSIGLHLGFLFALFSVFPMLAWRSGSPEGAVNDAPSLLGEALRSAAMGMATVVVAWGSLALLKNRSGYLLRGVRRVYEQIHGLCQDP